MKEKLGELYVKVSADVEQLEKEVNSLKSKLDKDAKKMSSSFSSTFKKGLQLAGGFLGLKAALDFGRKIIETASQFEQLRTRLVSLYGSTDKASQVFAKFKRIAATTPFSLRGVVEAGSTLKAFGMNAENTLKSVTDLAAFMGLDVVEAAQAVGRAFAGGVGAADVLRERGVLNLIKSFKGIDDLTKLTLPEFRKALIQAMQDPAAGIAGATDRMSKTFAGAMSNMGDALENFAAKIGTVFVPFLKSAAKAITNLVSPSKSLYEQWQSQKEKVGELEQKIPALLDKYDKLLPISKTNAEKQKELKSVINDIAKFMPEAITQWDSYGNAIALNKDKVKELLKAEKLRLQFLNKDAIKKYSRQKETIQNQIALITKQLNQGFKEVIFTNPEGKTFLERLKLKPEDIKNSREQLKQLNKDLLGISEQIKHLKGEDLITHNDGAKESGKIWTATGKTIGQIKERIAQLQKAQDGLLPGSKELKKNMLEIARLTALISQKQTASGNIKDNISLLEKEAEIYKQLYYGSKKWYDKNVELIKAQTQELIASGIKKEDALKLEKEKVKELNKEYDKLRITIEEINNLNTPKMPPVPGQLEGVPMPEKPTEKGETPEDFTERIIKSNKLAGASYQSLAEGFTEMLNLMHIRLRSHASEMEKIFANMANIFIEAIESMIAKWLAFNAISMIAGGGPIGLLSFLGMAKGGTIENKSGNITYAPSFADGASFMVPEGFPNDSYPILVESGERVDVTPGGRVNQLESTITNIHKQISILNANMIDLMTSKSNELNIDVGVEGKIGNDAIYLSNKKQSKILNRYGG
jgi:hypothetical protein